MLYAFAVPWEYALDLGEPLGNIARILNLLTLFLPSHASWKQGAYVARASYRGCVLALYMFFVCSFFGR